MIFLKRLLCEHEWKVERRIYGDEINASGGMRSLCRCTKCGKTKLSRSLDGPSNGGGRIRE